MALCAERSDGMEVIMKNNIISNINNDINLLNDKIDELDKQKMSRQKLQCTANYKQNLREQRVLEDKQRKFELHKEIVSNPDKTMEQWEAIFKSNAQKQIEKNLRDKSKKRISEKTYKKRERLIMAEYRLKLQELSELNKEIEQYGLSRENLIKELDNKIKNTKKIIKSKQEERKQLRLENELKNKTIDIKKEEYTKIKQDLENFMEEYNLIAQNNERPSINELNITQDIKNEEKVEEKKKQEKIGFNLKFNSGNEENKKVVEQKVVEQIDFMFGKVSKLKEIERIDDFLIVNEDESKESEGLKNFSFAKNKKSKPERKRSDNLDIIITVNNSFDKNVTIVDVVKRGFKELKYTLNDLNKYDNDTVFDFGEVKYLDKKEKKFYNKLAKQAMRNGFKVIGIEEKQIVFRKLLNSIFKRKSKEEQVEEVTVVPEIPEELADTNWRKKYIVQTKKDVNAQNEFSNNRKQVALTR